MSSFKSYKIYLRVSVLHITIQNIPRSLTVHRLKKTYQSFTVYSPTKSSVNISDY